MMRLTSSHCRRTIYILGSDSRRFPVSTTPRTPTRLLSRRIHAPLSAVADRLGKPSFQLARNLVYEPFAKMPKRLCIFSDGTWSTPEMDTKTNIFNLATCISQQDTGVPQLVYYDPGVGSDGSLFSRLKGGAFGEGIDLNIQQLYTFIAMNYEDGDEIMLFGYSRGAYTVRSLVGMMHEAGLVGRDKLDYVKEAYELYRDNRDPESERAKKFREDHARRVPIKLLACFDTVGALGIPFDPTPGFDIFLDSKRYQFHDTTLSEEVENAVHLMAIDEDRKSFQPTYMDGKPGQVTQLFLPGHHGGIGGGNLHEKDLADNSLLAMVEEIQKRCALGLQMEKLPSVFSRAIPFAGKPPFEYRLLRFFTGRKARDIPSEDMLHSTVYERFKNIKEWRPPALNKFNSVLSAFQG